MMDTVIDIEKVVNRNNGERSEARNILVSSSVTMYIFEMLEGKQMCVCVCKNIHPHTKKGNCTPSPPASYGCNGKHGLDLWTWTGLVDWLVSPFQSMCPFFCFLNLGFTNSKQFYTYIQTILKYSQSLLNPTHPNHNIHASSSIAVMFLFSYTITMITQML